MTEALKLIVELLTFLGVAAVTIAVSEELQRSVALRRRLGARNVSAAQFSAPLLHKLNLTNPFFLWVQSSTSISDSTERQKLRREMSLIGLDHPAAPIWYVIVRFVLAIGLPLGFLIGRWLFAVPMTSAGVIFWSLVFCCTGLLLPRSCLSRMVAARSRELEFGFPDALDLMVVCVEAGLSLEASFVRVGQEVRRSHPRIAKEFGRLSDELRAGKTRPQALRSLAYRTGVTSIKSFVALVIQTEALGTSIGQTLRIYSAEMRESRFIKAEEKALRIPVLMTIPLVVCILPVIVTSLLLPAFIDVVRVLLPSLAAHH